jgi:predicted amidohydrolase
MAQQDYFSIGAAQTEIYICNDRKEILHKNLQRHLELLDFMVPYWSGMMAAPCRLVVFPEFALHGLPQNIDGRWNGVAIDIPGEETALLGEKAKKLNIYIASHAWTEYPDFPDRPFSVGFLISPDGKVILKHHKVVETKILGCGGTAPGDAYDWFVEKFGDGLDAFFPVAETELGKVGFLICGEGQYAEIARGLMMNGAEIILRPNAWIEPYLSEPQDLMALCSRFCAFTNMCYLVEANHSYYYMAPGEPKAIGAGRSQIIDYTGRILTRAYTQSEWGVAAEINIQSLRRYREESSFLSRMVYMPNHIFRKVYETEMWPKNSLLNKQESNTMEEWDRIRREVIERRRDIYTPSKLNEK